MGIDDDIAFLERVPTLGLLGRAALRILAIGAETRYVHTGEVLFYAGDPADSGFVVQEGTFSVTLSDGEGGKTINVGTGVLLGELALLTATTRPATVTALEPATVLRIPRSLFLKMLEGYPDAATRLREIVAKRTDQAAREIYAVRSALDGPEST
jgi:CRP-like cAMP-binding protein